MSTDSTELTFVRCPSCRSLVPAVSTRCRMCGSAIDAQGKEATEPEAPRRARPTVQPVPDYSPPEPVRAAEPAAKEPAAAETDFEDFDPLRDYLDDDQAAAPAAAPKPPVAEGGRSTVAQPYQEEPPMIAAADPQSFDEDDFDIFGDDDDDDDDWLDSPVDDEPAPVEKKETRPEPVAPAAKAPAEPPAPKQERSAPQNMNGGGSRSTPQPQRDAGRVVVESGARPSGKPSGLSFGKGREESAHRGQQGRDNQQKTQDRQDKGGRPQQPPQSHKQAAPQQEKKVHQEPQRRDNPQQKQAKPAAPEKQERHPEPRPVPAAEVQRVRQDAGKAPVQEGVDSRLVGWLVSFSTPTRSSIELREGKFFVGGNSLKPNDLVLEDSSISTPHAMVAVESGRLQVQDLMSESGVFRRRQGESDFTQFGEPFDLKHGDWVRFGKVDFLVTMIPAEHKR